MIRLTPKIHDKYTLEFKIGYETKAGHPISDFITNLWLFIPENLESNEKIYVADSFFEDLKTRMRLTTPRYSLHALSQSGALPFKRIVEALGKPSDTANFRHQVSMTAAILKACLRDALAEAFQTAQNGDTHLEDFFSMARNVLSNYRALGHRMNSAAPDFREIYRRGDEFLCQSFLRYLYHQWKQTGNHPSLNRFLLEMQQYMTAQGYLLPEPGNAGRNREYIHRIAQLKKFIESDLYISAHKKHSGYLLEQLMFMLSAGLAMGFALFVNYYTSGQSGNFSLPIILLSIVSYMFKDRIKDWVRGWFHGSASNLFYDRRQRLEINGTWIGTTRQGVSYKMPSDLPAEIQPLSRRFGNNVFPDSQLHVDVLQYRRRLRLNRRHLRRLSHHPLQGTDEIMRFSLHRLMRWMAGPETELYRIGSDATIQTFSGKRTYNIGIILEIKSADNHVLRSFNAELSRSGLESFSSIPF